jgi:hypothetical protein
MINIQGKFVDNINRWAILYKWKEKCND